MRRRKGPRSRLKGGQARAVPTSMTQLRRDRRYEARLPVALLSLGGARQVFTRNVSYRGLFLCTELPLPKRQLVAVRVTLPEQDEDLHTNVVIGAPRPGGVGVSLFGLDGEPRTRWEGFIESLRDRHASREPRSSWDGAAAPLRAVKTSMDTADEALGSSRPWRDRSYS